MLFLELRPQDTATILNCPKKKSNKERNKNSTTQLRSQQVILSETRQDDQGVGRIDGGFGFTVTSGSIREGGRRQLDG